MPVRSDRERMDWLERQWVNVATPLRYGSKQRFKAYPTQHDGEADMDSRLREEIDKAMDEDRKGNVKGDSRG